MRVPMMICVVCTGAGISVQAGIPDFRSETGLFQTLKKENSTLSSGRDLFDASVFNVSWLQIISLRSITWLLGIRIVIPSPSPLLTPLSHPPVSALLGSLVSSQSLLLAMQQLPSGPTTSCRDHATLCFMASSPTPRRLTCAIDATS